MLSSLYMVLGMERIHLRPAKTLPVVVVTAMWSPWSTMEATGHERWMLLAPTRLAMLLGRDWAPVLLILLH